MVTVAVDDVGNRRAVLDNERTTWLLAEDGGFGLGQSILHYRILSASAMIHTVASSSATRLTPDPIIIHPLKASTDPVIGIQYSITSEPC